MSIFSPSLYIASKKESRNHALEVRFLPPLIAMTVLFTAALAMGNEATVTVLEDFEENAARNAASISHWRWSTEDKENAAHTTSALMEMLPGASCHGLKVCVDAPLPPQPEWLAIWHTRADYLPPEAVAVRFRAKVASGCFTITCGSATTYFACSDVWANPVALRAGDWTTVELPLLTGLKRNFRRAVFSAESPVVHYTRWIQEPLRLMIDSSSQGELWIDDVILVLADAQPAPPAQASVLSSADLEKAFTFATDKKEFDLAGGLSTEALRKPASLSWSATSPLLSVRQRGLEEMSFAAIPIAAPAGANAFRLQGRFVHESNAPFVVVDFLALVAPEGTAPWRIPPRTGKGFDLCLTPTHTSGTSWGFYHSRKRVPNNQPVTLDLPFVDFLCAYGQGDLRECHLHQLPLNPHSIAALSFTSPFGQRRADTLFLIDALETVSLNPPPGPSYPQPGPSRLDQ